MIIRLADQACYGDPPVTTTEVVDRAAKFDWLIARVEDNAPIVHQAGKKCLEYFQHTYRDKYNLGLTRDLRAMADERYLYLGGEAERKVLASRCAGYVQVHELDGLYLDTPFEHPDPDAALRAAVAIANAIRPKQTVVNFGDFFTAFYSADPYVGNYRWLFVHWFVQNCVDLTRDDWLDDWNQRRRPAIERRLASGRVIVVGINDPGRSREREAALLMMSWTDAPNLIWYYQDGALARPGYNWNSWMELVQR